MSLKQPDSDLVVWPDTGSNRCTEQVYVGSAEFRKLLISNRKMRRVDDMSVSLRGVMDVATGVAYMIHEQELFGARRPHAYKDG